MSNTNSEPKNILLVDSDEAFGEALKHVLGSDYLLCQASSVNEAEVKLEAESPHAILMNFDESGQGTPPDFHKLFQAASEQQVPVSVIAYSWDGRGNRAQEAFREGAFDILEQPLDIQQLKFALDRACRRMQLSRELASAQRLLNTTRIDGLLGSSKAIERVDEVARKVAEVQTTTVLITGESGTGKGLVAEAIHRLSPRSAKAFVSFSVCSFPDSLIEDELFGHERGAFTGANQARRGRFEEAHGGTIFIDEIGDLALPLQAKLLRVLQERTVERLGSNVSRPVDVRVICATNRNLEKMVKEGTFREDLYFRISVVKISMPALRERKEDIPVLAHHFLRTFAKTHNKAARAFTPGFVTALTRHSWPGNVRELQNVIERSVVLANGNEHLGVSDLPDELRGLTASHDLPVGSFQEAVQSFKRELVRSSLHTHRGNKSKAAQELGISRCYLHRLLNQLNMDDDECLPETDVDEAQEETRPVVRDGRQFGPAAQIA